MTDIEDTNKVEAEDSIIAYIKHCKEPAEKATEGPWKYIDTRGVISETGQVQTNHNHGTRSWTEFVAKAMHGYEFDAGSDAEKNMQFIAEAREALPFFIALSERYREALEFYADHYTWKHDTCATREEKIAKYGYRLPAIDYDCSWISLGSNKSSLYCAGNKAREALSLTKKDIENSIEERMKEK